MTSFAQPQLLVDKLVIIGPTEDGGTIQAICSGNEEREVCSQLGIDSQSIVRLEASDQKFTRSSMCATVHMFSVKPALTEDCCTESLQEGELLCPGFIDLHVHAPQVLLLHCLAELKACLSTHHLQQVCSPANILAKWQLNTSVNNLVIYVYT